MADTASLIDDLARDLTHGVRLRLLVTAVAAFIPAVRATPIDPVQVLRAD